MKGDKKKGLALAETRLLEKLLVNNPLYAWLQRWEVANLHRPAPMPVGLTIMNLVCGRGVERKAA